MSDLASYLAKNYLNASTAHDPSSKKRKRKSKKEHQSGLTIADDTAFDSHTHASNSSDDDTRATIVNDPSARAARNKSKWTSIGTAPPADADQLAADAILAEASRADAARKHAEDDTDAPQVVDESRVMSSGALGGLQSAAAVDAAMRRKRRAERQAFADEDPSATGRGQATVYRDASGRVIDVAMARAAARAQEAAKKEGEERAARAARGDVQNAQRAAKREKMEELQTKSLARYADDEEMNAELRAKDRWNDPMADAVRQRKGRSVTGRPLYKGAFEANRYGIRPGHRWDGVDRGNGFERKYFEARNRVKDKKNLEYAWEMDE